MKWLYLFSLIGLILGQAASYVPCCQIRISLLDVGVVALIIWTYIPLVLEYTIGITIRKLNLFKKIRKLNYGWYIFKRNRFECQSYLKIVGPFLLIACLSLLLSTIRIPLIQVFLSSLYLFRFIAYSQLILIPKLISIKVESQLKLLWMSGVILAVIGLFQYFLYPNLRNLSYLGWDPHEFRIFSTMLDPNFTGILYGLTLILGIYLKKGSYRSIYSFVNIGVLITLFLTYSRGAIISVFITLVIWIITQKKYYYLLFLFLIFVIAMILIPKPSNSEGVNLLRVLSIQSRITSVKEGFNSFRQFPVFGAGFNTIRFSRGFLDNSGEIDHASAGFQNSWIFILATTGIIGLISYIYIWKQIFKQSLSPILVYSFIVVSIHSLFDNTLFFAPVMYWIFLIAGISMRKFKGNN